MSTEFYCLETDTPNMDTRFVRWASGKARTLGGSTFEFGTVTNWESCRAMAEAGLTFAGVGAPCDDEGFGTPKWFDRLVRTGRATFGEFGITVAVGSETEHRFSTEF